MKRFLDVILVVGSAPAWLPIFLLVALLVRLKMGPGIFFRQKRPGKNGKIFELIKFRTLTNDRDAGGNLLPDSQRLTTFGGRLRSSSLDELPELLNVLRGDMSLVGPRPLLVQYLDRYTPEQMRRHEVKPGLTGWAQVNGRNAVSWEQKFKHDVWYVDHQSILLDLKIIALTLKTVFKREGINDTGNQVGMEEFRGNH
jgi:sugar transferase EpsL